MKSINNTKLVKFLSLVIAIFLWFFAMSDVNPSRTKVFSNIPIEVYGLREDLIITDKIVKSANVEVSGRRNIISNITRDDFNIELDLSRYGEGKHNIKLYSNDKFRYDDLKFEYKPEHITINIEKLVNKEFDIELAISGQLPEGVDGDKLSLSERTCSVSGPNSKVKLVNKIVANVDAKKIEGNTEIVTQLEPIDSEGKIVKDVKLSKKHVSLVIPYENNILAKINPVIVGELEENYELEEILVEPETVSLLKEDESAEDIYSVDTEEFDISNMKEDTEKSVKLIIPEGYSIIGEEKALIKLKVRESKEESKLLETQAYKLNISNENIVGKDSSIILSNPSEIQKQVDVEIEGEIEELEKIKEDSIILTLDFSNINVAGTFDIPISAKLNTKAKVKIRNVNPINIPITVHQNGQEN